MANETNVSETYVEDIMHRGVITCKADALLKEVVQTIVDTEVHAVVVVDDGGHVTGIVSHMDLLRLYGQNLLNFEAADAMTPKVIDIGPKATVREAVAMMLKHNIRRLLVTEETRQGKRPVGVIATTDVIRDMREQPWFW